MMGRQKNSNIPHRYTFIVTSVDVNVIPHGEEPEVVIEFQGALSARAKRQIAAVIAAGKLSTRETKTFLA